MVTRFFDSQFRASGKSSGRSLPRFLLDLLPLAIVAGTSSFSTYPAWADQPLKSSSPTNVGSDSFSWHQMPSHSLEISSRVDKPGALDLPWQSSGAPHTSARPLPKAQYTFDTPPEAKARYRFQPANDPHEQPTEGGSQLGLIEFWKVSQDLSRVEESAADRVSSRTPNRRGLATRSPEFRPLDSSSVPEFVKSWGSETALTGNQEPTETSKATYEPRLIEDLRDASLAAPPVASASHPKVVFFEGSESPERQISETERTLDVASRQPRMGEIPRLRTIQPATNASSVDDTPSPADILIGSLDARPGEPAGLVVSQLTRARQEPAPPEPVDLLPMTPRVRPNTSLANDKDYSVARYTGPLAPTEKIFSQLEITDSFQEQPGESLQQVRTETDEPGEFEFEWMPAVYTWASPSFFHRPLYFEQPNLERYGIGPRPCAQPLVSGLHFFGTVFVMPYKLMARHPHEPHYALGNQRPGDPIRHQGRVFLGQSHVRDGSPGR